MRKTRNRKEEMPSEITKHNHCSLSTVEAQARLNPGKRPKTLKKQTSIGPE